MKIFLTAWIIVAFSPFLSSQGDKGKSLGEIKQWTFHVQKGEIKVKLSSAADVSGEHLVLSLEPQDDLMATSIEEGELLRQILREMPSSGQDPRKLDLITTWLQNSEFRSGVEQAVAKSGTWRSCLGSKYCHKAQRVANQFLKSVDAFKAFDDTLNSFGLRRKWTRVDDMAVGERSGHVSSYGIIMIAIENEK